jgi:hypothetical protein
MLIAILLFAALGSHQGGPALNCMHMVVRQAHLANSSGDKRVVLRGFDEESVHGNLDDSGRMLFTSFRVRCDLVKGKAEPFNLYQVAIGGRRLVIANNAKVEGDVDKFHDWKAFRMKPDRIEGNIEDLTAAPLSHDGNRLYIWAQYFSGFKHCYAVVDLARPEQGAVLLYSEGFQGEGKPGEPIPVWGPVHASDALEWLVGGQIRKEDGTLISRLPSNNESGQEWHAQVWSSKDRTAFWFDPRNEQADQPWQLVTTRFGEGVPRTSRVDVDIPRKKHTQPGKLLLLPSGRLLVSTVTQYPAEPRYELMLSDKARRHWRKIGDYVLRGASWDAKNILIGGPKLSDKQWIVQITE